MKDYTYLDNHRYERKFIAEKIPGGIAESLVKRNSACFSESYPPRQVNNIYFDTPGMDCYHDNLFGIGKRWKVRIRWYNDLFGRVDAAILEFKIKKGFTGTKRSYELPGFNISREHFDSSLWKHYFNRSSLPDDVKARLAGLQPVLLNTYQRSYFVSAGKRFRITVDGRMEYYNMRPTWNHFLHLFREHDKTVIELKYDFKWDNEAGLITNEIPFRVMKNSKYISGISHFKSEIAR
jgi:hypothetical protein